MNTVIGPISRRSFVQWLGAAGASVALGSPSRAHARSGATSTTQEVLDADAGPVDLWIRRSRVDIDGRAGRAVTINGAIPGPLLRMREGGEVEIRVHNALDEDTSVHWHGILVPNRMDGVPGVNFPGIRPGETFVYRFPVRQYGTYWYHAHSAFQEQQGHYGPLVIAPRTPPPYAYDREHVVVLSDWTFEDPHRVFRKLKTQAGYYNRRRRTLTDLLRDSRSNGIGAALRDRIEWGRMRMDPTDISDVTGVTYTYLLNGAPPSAQWTASFKPGERVLLRFINASAATYFDVRIPGLTLKVVEVSGQNVVPVDTDEFRMAIAETYAVVVEPRERRPYALFAEAIDRSGYALGALSPSDGMTVPVPPRRDRPLLTMADMGMAHGAINGDHDAAHAAAGGRQDGHDASPASAEDHGGHGDRPPNAGAHSQHAPGTPLRPPGTIPEPEPHGADTHGPANAAVPMTTRSRLSEPGVGLGHDGRDVLTYAMLRALEPREDFRAPDREIELHLTGNMERFMWSIDGVKASDAPPIQVRHGERIRLTLVNDTMMNHPMHLHGMWMELENGNGERIPRVHTVNVQPAERLSLLFTADAPGPWAFHCHVLYHMEAGMFRVVHVSQPSSSHDAAGERRAEEPTHDAHGH